MAMPRKVKPEPATKADVESAVSHLATEIGKLATKADLSTAMARVARELDQRPTRTEMQESFAGVNVKLDRIIGVLDTVAGKQHDNDQSHTVFGAMLGEHRRTLASHDHRLTSLESRLPPTTP